MNRSQYIINIIGEKKVAEIAALEKKYEETGSAEDYAAYMAVATPAFEMVMAEDVARGYDLEELWN